MNDLSVATKLVPSPYVVGLLKAAGRRAADEFLEVNGDKLGREGTADLPEMFG